ncbi:TPA: hypothetical protein ACH3X1_008647 [Trebouxia sp. C0004]
MWDHFNKKKVSAVDAAKLHRNFDAVCKGCNQTVAGKTQLMKRHLVDCQQATTTGLLDALRDQTKHATSDASGATTSTNQSQQASSLTRFVDRVKVTPHQLTAWRNLLAIAFIMTGWSFQTVENPHFVDFMAHVRPNFSLPSMIIKGIEKWGGTRFAGIVTDNASNMQKTRRLVLKRFPHMIEVRS